MSWINEWTFFGKDSRAVRAPHPRTAIIPDHIGPSICKATPTPLLLIQDI